jgi:hypothetical protein
MSDVPGIPALSDPSDEIGEADPGVIGNIVARLFPHLSAAEIIQLVAAVLPLPEAD